MTELAHLATKTTLCSKSSVATNCRTRLVESHPPNSSRKLLPPLRWTRNGASNSSPRSMKYQQMNLSVCYHSLPSESAPKPLNLSHR